MFARHSKSLIWPKKLLLLAKVLISIPIVKVKNFKHIKILLCPKTTRLPSVFIFFVLTDAAPAGLAACKNTQDSKLHLRYGVDFINPFRLCAKLLRSAPNF